MVSKYFDRISRIDALIRRKATGSPKALAKKLDISESHLYLYLVCMKNLGAPIAYSRVKESYYYKNEGYFNFTFTMVDAEVTSVS